MNSYHIIKYDSTGTQINCVTFDKFNKSIIQAEFDRQAIELAEGEELEYMKETPKEFCPAMLVVIRKNGELKLQVIKGSRCGYKPYTIKSAA
jgi:hypothetical protein